MTGLALEDVTITDFTSQISDNLGSPIATGSFGEVYRCTVGSNAGRTEIAVKMFRIEPEITMDKLANVTPAILRELQVWLRLKHSTIVPLLGTARVDSPLLALVSEWMPSGKLSDYLDKQAATIATRIGLVKGIAEGLHYLHSKNVIHGDLHPGNVLIDSLGNPRLTDFGLATVAEDPELQLSTLTVGRNFDARWRAPEVVGVERGPDKPTFESDIYSFGSLMFFIVSRDMPWKEKHSHHIYIELWKRATPARPGNISDSHWDLIKKCWSWKPADRPNAARVLQIAVTEFNASMSIKNVVLFGETGVGKSSVVNLMAGRQIAETSRGTGKCTLHWEEHPITFDGYSYKVFDTIGLEEHLLAPKEFVDAILNAHNLITQLDNEGGIDLLLFCVRAGRVTGTLKTIYRLFYEWLCEKKVPIVIVLTGLEKEDRMGDWWGMNECTFQEYGINVAGHACITVTREPHRRHQELYEESRHLVRDLVFRHTYGMERGASSKVGGYGSTSVVQKWSELTQNLFMSTAQRKNFYVLTKRCGVPRGIAVKLVRSIF